jgi:hypothetical protein
MMWKKCQIHQNDTGMDHGRRGGRCAEHPKKADLPHRELSVQMANYGIIDIIYE